MINNTEPTYESVSKELTDEETVESYVFRSTMTAAEKKEADAEFRKLRFEQLKNMSDEQRLKGELLRMKLLMEDYFKQSKYIATFLNQPLTATSEQSPPPSPTSSATTLLPSNRNSPS